MQKHKNNLKYKCQDKSLPPGEFKPIVHISEEWQNPNNPCRSRQVIQEVAKAWDSVSCPV